MFVLLQKKELIFLLKTTHQIQKRKGILKNELARLFNEEYNDYTHTFATLYAALRRFRKTKVGLN
jgi:hypothetical protein